MQEQHSQPDFLLGQAAKLGPEGIRDVVATLSEAEATALTQ